MKSQTMDAVQRNLAYQNLFGRQYGKDAAALWTEMFRRLGGKAKAMPESTFNDKVLEARNIDEIAEELEVRQLVPPVFSGPLHTSTDSVLAVSLSI